jgi:hypothetical protein
MADQLSLWASIGHKSLIRTATAGDVRALANPQEAAAEEPSSRKASRCDIRTGNSSMKSADLQVAASTFPRVCTKQMERAAKQQLLASG